MSPRPLATLVGLAAVTLGGCRTATQIEVTVTTDLPCARLNGGASVTSGRLIEIEGAPPTTTSRVCRDQRLGAVVLIPSDSDDAQVAFKVIGAIDGQDVEQCLAPNYGPKCIVARRALRFEPHTALEVPVELRASCAGVPCGPTQTCVQGACVDATVDPSLCVGPTGCGEEVLGGGAPADAGSDAGNDATAGDATVGDAAADGGADATLDAADTGPIADAQPTFDGTVLGCDLRGAQPGSPYPMEGYCPTHRHQSPLLGPQATPTHPWLATFSGIPYTPVIAADGTIYVATYQASLYAFYPDGGARWTATVPAVGDASVAFGNAPAIGADGTVYALYRSSANPLLMGFDPADGGVRWSTGIDDSRSAITIGPDGTLYFTGTVPEVEAVTRAGGTRFVTSVEGGVDFSSPSIGADGTLYVGGGTGALQALYPDGGARWLTPVGPDLNNSLGDTVGVSTDGLLHVSSYQAASYYGVRPDGGGVAWTAKLHQPATGAAIDDRGVAFVSTQSESYFVAPDGSATVVPNQGSCNQPAIGRDGVVYASCGGPAMFAVDRSGNQVWTHPHDGAAQGAPVIGPDQTLYLTVDFGDGGAGLYAFH